MRDATFLPPVGMSPDPGASRVEPDEPIAATETRGTLRVTQLDVARAAGVHNTTVSLALRNSPSIPAVTRARIQALAEQLGYRPDPALRALVAYRNGLVATQRSQPIAYVTNGETRWGWREFAIEESYFVGAQRKAAECGYQLEHFWLGEPGMTARRLSDVLFHRGITGLLFASHPLETAAPLDFAWDRFSGIKLGPGPSAPALHRVSTDPAADIRMAVQRTLAACYRRPGLILPDPWGDTVGQALSAGFLVEQHRLSADQRVPIFELPALTAHDGLMPMKALKTRAALAQWFEEFQPNAILGPHALVSEMLSAVGIQVPGHVAFVDPLLTRTASGVAGVIQNSERVGEVAVDILVGQLQQNLRGLPAFPTTTLVEGSWSDGASLPRARVSSWDTQDGALAKPAATAA